MVYSIENCYGKFNLKECYDCETNETFYDVYEEEIYGDYLGEFHTEFSFDYDTENIENDFEVWCVENI